MEERCKNCDYQKETEDGKKYCFLDERYFSDFPDEPNQYDNMDREHEFVGVDMTNQEAIEELADVFTRYDGNKNKDVLEAFDKAIEALQQIKKIKDIVNSPYFFMREDVFAFRYEAICKIVEE